MKEDPTDGLRISVTVIANRYEAVAVSADMSKGKAVGEAVLDLAAARTASDQFTVMPLWGTRHWHLGSPEPFDRVFINSIAPAACLVLRNSHNQILDLGDLAARFPDDVILVSSISAMRNLCSMLTGSGGGELNRLRVSERIRTDFSAFRHLWAQASAVSEFAGPPEKFMNRMQRRIEVGNIGRVMASFHNGGIYLTDAHYDNFRGGGTKFVDIDGQHDWMLLGPSPAQCATAFIPLLMGFDASDYREFSRGYRAARDPAAAAEDVFNCVEFGDSKGWMRHLVAKNWLQVYDLTHAQLLDIERSGYSPSTQLLRALAISCSYLNRPSEAEENFEEAIDLAEDEDQPLLHLNYAAHLLRHDLESGARQHLLTVIDLSRGTDSSSGLLQAASQMLGRLT